MSTHAAVILGGGLSGSFERNGYSYPLGYHHILHRDRTLLLPQRYVLLSVPLFVLAYFAVEMHATARVRAAVQYGLLAIVLVLLPLNTRAGLAWRDWYRDGMAAVERDVWSGAPPSAIAATHRQFLMHWDRARLASGIEMLRDAGIGPFATLRARAATVSAEAPRDEESLRRNRQQKR